MLRALGFKGSASLTQEEINQKVANQALQLERALKAMDYVLDDRAEEAFRLLDDHDNIAISQLAYGVVQFLEATLGFEPETMKKASETLSKAETMAWKEKTSAERNNVKSSQIYPPGTEFAVAYAESNLLNALLMLLSENFMEGAKALLKLRRAYQTLDAISKHLSTPPDASSSALADLDSYPTCSKSNSSSFVDLPLPLTEQELKDRKIIDELDQTYHMRKSRINGSHIGNPPVSDSLRSNLGFKDESATPASDKDVLKFGNPEVASVDEYIHSGVNLCFGILQVVLSLIPHGIGKVLSVVGFKGSREAGLQMVWNAAQERNIHGGIGLLALLVFYDGPFQFTDVDFDVPTAEELSQNDDKTNKDIDTEMEKETAQTLQKIKTSASTASKKELVEDKIALERMATSGHGETLLHPGEKLVKVLLHSRALFPHSNLWLLQESRMLASRGRLHEAVDLMDTAKPSQMKQVDALLGFDRCMILVFLHHFDRAASDFLDLIKINSYSHALYTWFAAACYLEAYRMSLTGLIPKDTDVDPSKIDTYAKLAEKYIHEAPKLIGKKKFLSKIPPFEKFIARKYKEIEDSHNSHPKTPFIDCIQTSLVHELAYFWNGYNRMSTECLQLSISLLAYSATPTSLSSSSRTSSDVTSGNSSMSIHSSASNKTLDLLPSPIALTLTNKETGLPYAKIHESKEQRIIRVTLQCLALRRLGYIKEGLQIFDKVVISNLILPDGRLTKLNENPYLYPTALYERALFTWKLDGADGLAECMKWLKYSQAYGGDDYELSTRVTMKTKAAIDRLEDLDF
ncbi:hypothetical protein PICMEDRAFT_15231 [Pichia membranifaciens NRRL Y-2026]|uniref:Inclusion body clearance protein IML2 n=1 Tax=Pichia membranifaciens NRRL Y-2026 TaxID=763406 RepID=A0A1E3NM95_9ASCO|nr:hypothetical protein PICMEDRAFT_15231 [Pichia membranifaciens NRRL Y-2026]ODQ47250.1 hypothetical protein PICMEDRAFT_15231 [Pichia membranifaciens NRRL Y-2026]